MAEKQDGGPALSESKVEPWMRTYVKLVRAQRMREWAISNEDAAEVLAMLAHRKGEEGNNG